jgi:DNA polymerase (family 10)
LYTAAGLPFIPPEMREEGHELTLAASGRMPTLLEPSDVRGALHCHTTYSDGKATLAEMAEASRARGWSYIGITDHSQAAFYAGGLSREKVLAQHNEIDALNTTFTDFRILKGIEADILPDGTLDYDAELLDRFDFVVGSIHSQLSMDTTTMTARVLRALDDPYLTILGHPTGRLLLSREPYAVDMNLVLEKAGYLGVAVELNADPKRLDLDWRLIPRAKAAGVTIEIGPDAHSTKGLDTMAIGVGIARKAGVETCDVLNAGSADDVLAFARARRERGG